jgi:hypothetical protein
MNCQQSAFHHGDVFRDNLSAFGQDCYWNVSHGISPQKIQFFFIVIVNLQKAL